MELQIKNIPIINTVTPAVIYPLYCITDITSLLSGTAIKVFVVYILDYVIKQNLGTYHIFSCIYDLVENDWLCDILQ